MGLREPPVDRRHKLVDPVCECVELSIGEGRFDLARKVATGRGFYDRTECHLELGHHPRAGVELVHRPVRLGLRHFRDLDPVLTEHLDGTRHIAHLVLARCVRDRHVEFAGCKLHHGVRECRDRPCNPIAYREGR